MDSMKLSTKQLRRFNKFLKDNIENFDIKDYIYYLNDLHIQHSKTGLREYILSKEFSKSKKEEKFKY